MKEQNDDVIRAAKKRAQIAILAYERKCIEVITSKRPIVLQKSPAFNQYRVLFDTIDFCVVYDLDIVLLRNQVKCAETEWRENLNARLLAMTMYECVDDLSKIFGREFQDAVAQLTFNYDLKVKLNKHLKEINDFRKRHESSLKAIRNATAAHRELDLETLLPALGEVEPKLLIDLALSLHRLLKTFYETMSKVLREAKQLVKWTHAIRTLKPS